jgi:hypothetical protein
VGKMGEDAVKLGTKDDELNSLSGLIRVNW